VEIITDKVTFELPSPGSGILRAIIAPEKSVVPVGYIIGLVGDVTDPLPDVSAENRALLERRRQAVEEHAAAPVQISSRETSVGERIRDRGKVRATPAARRLAREHQVDLTELAASIGFGLVQEEHVLRWLEERKGKA